MVVFHNHPFGLIGSDTAQLESCETECTYGRKFDRTLLCAANNLFVVLSPKNVMHNFPAKHLSNP